MPDGKRHALATVITSIAIPASMIPYRFPTSEITLCAVGILTTLAINPDLDLNTRIPWNNAKKLLWVLLWYPYSRMIKHRSVWSHAPVIGTLLRTIYILIPIYFVMELAGLSIHGVSLIWIWIGMAISDLLHVGMDLLDTCLKKSCWE